MGELVVVAPTTQSAVSLPDGCPHATEVSPERFRPLEGLTSVHTWGDVAIEVPVHRTGFAVADVPMAIQVLDVQDRPVIDPAAVGLANDDSLDHTLYVAVKGMVRMVGSEVEVESPTPMAKHVVWVGQVIVPTEVMLVEVDANVSAPTEGVQVGVVDRLDGSPVSWKTLVAVDPTVPVPLSSHVAADGVAGDGRQAIELRVVKVVEAGVSTFHRSAWVGARPTDPPSSTDPVLVVPMA